MSHSVGDDSMTGYEKRKFDELSRKPYSTLTPEEKRDLRNLSERYKYDEDGNVVREGPGYD